MTCDIVVTPSGCCASSADGAPPHDMGRPFQIEKCWIKTPFHGAEPSRLEVRYNFRSNHLVRKIRLQAYRRYDRTQAPPATRE
jgi:hypothetical protein